MVLVESSSLSAGTKIKYGVRRQLGEPSDCGSDDSGFESRRSPQTKRLMNECKEEES